ncbi:MAG: hypothetical protein OXE84_04465 [Rhodobacteraceae bacterium]|nr:hypothetical protein [Paracoccaceae bacterium]MCY4196525.1 hypothetical protein [Paracoccaceae bacterium]
MQDAPERLDLREEVLNLVVPAIQIPVIVPNHLPVLAGRDDDLDSPGFEIGKPRIGIKGLVSDEGRAIKVLKHCVRSLEVMGMTGEAGEAHKVAKGIRDRHKSWWSGRPGSDQWPDFGPFSASSLGMRLDDGAVNTDIFKIEVFRSGSE